MTSTARRTAASSDVQPTLLDAPADLPSAEPGLPAQGFAGLRIEDLLPPATAARAGAAQQALADFAHRTRHGYAGVPGDAVPTILGRVEAMSSSRIEQVVAPARQVVLAERGESESREARLVLGCASAIEAAPGLDPGTPGLVALQRRLFAGTPAQVGLRHQPVWIGPSGSTIAGAHFVPVDHRLVPDMLEEVWVFLSASSALPLAQASVGHAQFETIHPFVDGNGRIGRAILISHLRRTGLVGPLAPISTGLLTDLDSYFAALGAFRSGDAAPIVEVFSGAAHAAVAAASNLLDELGQLRGAWAERVRARSDSVAWRVADALLHHPVATSESAAGRHGVSAVAARTAIAALADAGVLVKASEGRRNQVWVAEEVTNSYDQAALAASRRFA